jgi:hypothetical protein
MSDFRNPNDPLWRGTEYEPTRGANVGWGWIAGALVLVILVAIALGVGRGPTQTASNDTMSPAANHLAPPPANPHPGNPAMPGLVPPPAPQAPAPQGGSQSQ